MRKHSAWLFELLLRVLLPAGGRHRSADAPPEAGCEDAAAPVPLRVLSKHAGLLRGEDVPLIRPYILTPEERRALWPAAHGIDTGPRRIYGVEAMV
ncbi:hypothetical protein MOV08_28765 [Streptomyces yunnanensis]|uniref:Uncharacterized protein n=1 Tax=Streptomyces yunnanensis TaxID=156453 RepID=A0ABY8AGP9_9ACTN|nr:hypothetical protein [Streptomyces yunnanensis]WEB42851.1 hypothetical protein MOV08_28765 [Streptomyces yunnanensis]